MNPETITTGQIFSSLTGKHWTALLTVIFTVIGSTFSGGFWAGKIFTEHQSAILQAELKGALSIAQAKLEGSQGKNEQLSVTLLQWQSAHRKMQTDFSQQQQTIASLTKQLGQSNNCTFIHQQIIATQKLIEHPTGVMVAISKEDKENENERIALLQRRLENYTQQLSSCNK